MARYKKNHYVPEWYQYRFLSVGINEKKFYYLDLKPEKIVKNNHSYTRNELLRWGPPKCFCQDDLYTTKYGKWESTEIEQYFFGEVDNLGRKAVEYFTNFTHPSVNQKAFHALLTYMSLQKIRTPEGLTYLANKVQSRDKNQLLMSMQKFQQMYCAVWTECVWAIADASQAKIKFIVSDHPITVYNKGCFPASLWCIGVNDPDIRFFGTHTLFPLSSEKILILTNLSWMRNPYSSPIKKRPNPNLYRDTIFNFNEIQTGRILTDQEVSEINYIIKQRAYRFIAAEKKEWLFPEKYLSLKRWDKLGDCYLLMADPRSMSFSTQSIIGYKNNKSDIFDAYGRKPWQQGYDGRDVNEKEWESFHAFQGEFARVFGSKRRGVSFEMGGLDKEEDSQDYHAYHLSLEQKFKPRKAGRKRK